MNNSLKKFTKELNRITLRSSEKAHIRSAILSHIDAFVPAQVSDLKQSELVISPFASHVSYILHSARFYAAAALTFVFVLGGGISFAAERSVPGDTLYSVKTSVNETLKTSLALSDGAKMQVMRELVNERLVEAEKLAAKGNFTPENKEVIETKLEAHVDSFADSAHNTETGTDSDTKDTLEQTSKLESSLEAHANVLSKLGDVSPEAENFAGKVKTEAARVSDYRAGVEEKIADNAKADLNEEKNVLAELDETKKIVEEARALADRTKVDDSKTENDSKNDSKDDDKGDDSDDISKKLDGAVKDLKDAKEKIKDHSYAKALLSISKARRTAEEYLLTVKAVKDLDINFENKQETKVETKDDTCDSEQKTASSTCIIALSQATTTATATATTTATTSLETKSEAGSAKTTISPVTRLKNALIGE